MSTPVTNQVIFALASNITANSSTLSIGNSSVNTEINSTSITTGTLVYTNSSFTNLLPLTDNAYAVGNTTKRWTNGDFSSIMSVGNDTVNVAINSTGWRTGNLTIGSSLSNGVMIIGGSGGAGNAQLIVEDAAGQVYINSTTFFGQNANLSVNAVYTTTVNAGLISGGNVWTSTVNSYQVNTTILNAGLISGGNVWTSTVNSYQVNTTILVIGANTTANIWANNSTLTIQDFSNVSNVVTNSTSIFVQDHSNTVLINSSTIFIGNSTSNTTINSTAFSGDRDSFRNLIINGDMSVDHINYYNTLHPVTGQYLCDKWSCGVTNTSATFTSVNIFSNTLYQGPPGFRNILFMRNQANNILLSSTDQMFLSHRIDVIGMGDQTAGPASLLQWGTPTAQTVTLSFWASSNQITGTFGGCVISGNVSTNNNSYPFTYQINTTGQWTYNEIVIPGPTDALGGVYNFNGLHSQILFSWGCGSFYQASNAFAWTSANATGHYYNAPTGTVNIFAGNSNNNTWMITGVQLELGSQATAFEHRSPIIESAMCNWYSRKVDGYNWGGYGTTSMGVVNPVYVGADMRPLITPSFTKYGSFVDTNFTFNSVADDGYTCGYYYGSVTAAGGFQTSAGEIAGIQATAYI